MAIGIVKGESSLFLKKELQEGQYEAPTSADDAVEVLEDGLEFSYTRDIIERNTLSSTIERVAPRLGIKQISGTVPTEFVAGKNEGDKPRSGLMFESLLGAVRQITSEQISDDEEHTASRIYFSDTSAFSVGDIVLIKETGAYECRPIAAIEENEYIDLAFDLENGAPSNEVAVGKMSLYYHDSPAPTISATHYIGGKIEEQIEGLRCVSASLENWSTAQVGTWNFGLEGLDLRRDVASPAFPPDFSQDALPPVLLNACIWLNGVKVPYNEFGLNIENTKGEITSACSESGKISSRFTDLNVSGSINPYMEDDNVDRFNQFNLNENVSIFGYAYNPAANDGEFNQIVAFWLPQVKLTEIPTSEQDGIVTDQIAFQAFRGQGNDTVFIGFI